MKPFICIALRTALPASLMIYVRPRPLILITLGENYQAISTTQDSVLPLLATVCGRPCSSIIAGGRQSMSDTFEPDLLLHDIKAWIFIIADSQIFAIRRIYLLPQHHPQRPVVPQPGM